MYMQNFYWHSKNAMETYFSRWSTNSYKLLGTPYNADGTAVAYAMPFSGWPEIIPTDGSVGSNPYIWYQPTVDPAKALTGETVYFARQSNFKYDPNVVANTSIAFNLDAGADNAFLVRLAITPYINTDQQMTISYQFTGGNMDLSYSNVETAAPYNWQKIYNFSDALSLNSNITNFDVNLEFKVANYQQPHGSVSTNPAMLQYAFNLHTFTDAMETPAVPSFTPLP